MFAKRRKFKFEHHTFLHHSQTVALIQRFLYSLSTIHFYIILKLSNTSIPKFTCLSTIHFYIILKPTCTSASLSVCLSTIHFYIILKLSCLQVLPPIQFEHHTFLHHSQTPDELRSQADSFEHHTFLHHSQTSN